MPASITTFMQWAIKTAGSGLPATQLIDNVTGRLGAVQEIVDSSGQNASLTGRTNRMRVTALPVEPSFNMQPTALEWTYLLPWLLGGSSAGTTPIEFDIGNDLPLRGVQGVEDRNGTPYPHNYTDLAVDSFTVRSQPGQLLSCEIQTVGTAYENATAFPALANFDNLTSPFAFPDLTADGATGSDGVFLIGGVSRQAFSASIGVSYNLDRTRRPHTLAASGLRKRQRDIVLQLQMPADEAQAIYATDLRGLTTRAVSMRWRNPVQTVEFIEFEFPSVIFPLADVDLPLRDEIKPTITGMVKFNGTDPAMTVRVQIRT